MWSRVATKLAGDVVLAIPFATTASIVWCEHAENEANINKSLDQKKNTLQLAGDNDNHHHPAPITIRRVDTKGEILKIKKMEKEMLERWDKDEDGWRKLPARAWPAYQPDSEQLNIIRDEILKCGCKPDSDNAVCNELFFDTATSLVFNNIDPEAGLQQYKELAEKGHVDSMVACGIILLEGCCDITPNEEEGVQYLIKAVARDSVQGTYELGALFYTGLDELLEEDPLAAFEFFEKAAGHDHPAAIFMMAECLYDGEGTEQSVARAVPLFYRAAEFGHRFSRQRIRQLLANKSYQA